MKLLPFIKNFNDLIRSFFLGFAPWQLAMRVDRCSPHKNSLGRRFINSFAHFFLPNMSVGRCLAPAQCNPANGFKKGTYKPLKARLQKGDILIEALIGLMLMAIVAVGVTTITSKVEKGKREMSVQDLAISQLQELLVKNGNGTIDLCDSTIETITLPDETIEVDATGCTKVAATINGVALTDLNQPIVLSATSTKTGAVYTVGGVATQ